MEYLLYTRGLMVDYSHHFISSNKIANELFRAYIDKTDWDRSKGKASDWKILLSMISAV